MWHGAMPAAGLWELGLGVPECSHKAVVSGCTCIAEAKCPVRLAAALEGDRAVSSLLFLSSTVNHEKTAIPKL